MLYERAMMHTALHREDVDMLWLRTTEFQPFAIHFYEECGFKREETIVFKGFGPTWFGGLFRIKCGLYKYSRLFDDHLRN